MLQKQKVEDIVLEKVQSSHQFSPYYHNNSLLIQLMLAEMINIHQVISTISLRKPECSILAKELSALVGDPFLSLNLPYFNRIKGTLGRLIDYTNHFYLNATSQIQSRTNLREIATQAWISGINHLFLMNELTTCQEKRKKTSLLSKLKRSIKTLMGRIQRISKAIERLLELYIKDETVIFFILRNKERLIDVFGDKRMKRILNLKSKNVSLNHYLISYYQHKGFFHLIPTIKQELSLHESY